MCIDIATVGAYRHDELVVGRFRAGNQQRSRQRRGSRLDEIEPGQVGCRRGVDCQSGIGQCLRVFGIAGAQHPQLLEPALAGNHRGTSDDRLHAQRRGIEQSQCGAQPDSDQSHSLHATIAHCRNGRGKTRTPVGDAIRIGGLPGRITRAAPVETQHVPPGPCQ